MCAQQCLLQSFCCGPERVAAKLFLYAPVSFSCLVLPPNPTRGHWVSSWGANCLVASSVCVTCTTCRIGLWIGLWIGHIQHCVARMMCPDQLGKLGCTAEWAECRSATCSPVQVSSWYMQHLGQDWFLDGTIVYCGLSR